MVFGCRSRCGLRTVLGLGAACVCERACVCACVRACNLCYIKYINYNFKCRIG